MKRFILGLCLFSPLLVVAGKDGKRCKFPHGKTIEVSQKLRAMADETTSPASPVQEDNLGVFDCEQLYLDDGIDENYFSDEQQNNQTEESESTHKTSPAKFSRRALLPAERSSDWRQDPRSHVKPLKPYLFGREIFTPAQQSPKAIAIVGNAMQLYKKNNR